MIDRTKDFTSTPEVKDGKPASFPGAAAGSLVPSPSLPDSFEPGSREWFEVEHGISMDVANARPYRFWRTPQELIDFCKDLPVSQAFVRNVAEQSPTGIIIERSFGGSTFKRCAPWPTHYLPELRPDKAVRTKGNQKFWHYHGDVTPKFPPRIPPEHLSATDRKKYPKGKPLTWARPSEDAVPFAKLSDEDKLKYPKGKPARKAQPGQIHKAANMRDHIDRDKFPGDHAGVNLQYAHFHLCDPAKYIFFPGKDNAASVDVNPFAMSALFEARRVFFGIEGCIKGDSMVSAILKAGKHLQGETAVSVPSVTLWGAPELDRFIDHFLKFISRALGGDSPPEIVIVPDADAYNADHRLVRQQALFFRSYLRRKGLRATIAAPPECDLRGMHAKCVKGEKCKANGVDDFLARGGTLEGLIELERELPVGAFNAWAVEQHFMHGHRVDRIRTDRALLEGLVLYGTDDGKFKGWLSQIIKASGLSRTASYDAAHRLKAAGVITTDKPIDRTQREFKKANGEMMTPFDFEDPVTFTVVPKELHCAPDTFHRLGEPVTTTEYHRESVDLQRKQLDVLESIDRRLAQTIPTVVEEAEAILSADRAN